jgi:hypothetical protein
MQPLHKLALHNVSQRDGVAASHSNKKLVELAIVITILKVLEMSPLLPCDPWPDKQTLCKCTMQTNYANENAYR